MKEQLIIALSREHGSGGHVIAEKLAEQYQIPFYDKNLLNHIADEKSVNVAELHKYDEKPRHKLFTRTVRGYTNSPEENIAQMQFEFLKRKADAGDSFVIVGRCAEHVLRDNPNMISIFVLGNTETKIVRIMERDEVSREEAEKLMRQTDKERSSYYNHHCPSKWGNARNHELSINSSKLGLDETARIIAEYIDSRRK